MHILYQGLLRSPASWARVGRGYLKELARLGVDFAALQVRGFRYQGDFPLPEGVRELTRRELAREPEVGLGFLHPPLVHRLLGGKKVNLFVWESDRVPAAWVDGLERGTDLVVVPSHFTRRALLASGFPARKAVVVPYGFDAQHIAGGAEAARGERPFTFYSVVSPHRRKGIRELLSAYGMAFRKDDGVLLRLKTTYDPGAAARRFSFEIDSWNQILGEFEGKAPPVELELRTLDDAETASLYRKADVYVQASWGESFGLALLDALASGLPAIATGWGGHMDYFAESSDALPFHLEEDAGALYEPVPGAHVAVPDVEALAERMRWHREHPVESKGMGEALRQGVAGLTWGNSTKRLLAVLDGA